ncbi:armadillo-type protein [Pilobolus umbonatus]|nr:armadillo-type protein [Pilobolus umbonatus]
MESFDIHEFDSIIQAFYEGNDRERQEAQTLLSEFQNNPNSWQLVDRILESSRSIQAKFIALGVLEDFIVVRWTTLPMEQRLIMRDYIVKLIIGIASNESTLLLQKTYLNKLDLVLVQILKKDWPQYWPTFIQEIVDSSLTNMSLCENNMRILKLLSEEVFDFSADQMTQAKMHKLKSRMIDELGSIFYLCKTTLTNPASTGSLKEITLETLLKFISWIPTQFIFQDDLLVILKLRFTKSPVQRNLTIQCFTEIVSLDTSTSNLDTLHIKLIDIYQTVMNQVEHITSKYKQDLPGSYKNFKVEDQEFIQEIAIFITTYLDKHRILTEEHCGHHSVKQSLDFLLNLSRIEEREIWKICLEYWGKLTYDILQAYNRQSFDLLTHYGPILKELTDVIINNMVKPDEVLIVEDEDGDITRSFIRQSDTTALYNSMRHCLCLLTNIDSPFIQQMIQQKLHAVQYFNNTDWSWEDLFKLCWSIGSISSALTLEDEDSFLETITHDLIQLLSSKQSNKDQEFVIASCLLYIAGQYPHFLKSHTELLSFILDKIFSYMHDSQTAVREMACDAFLKISQGCHQVLILPQPSTSVLDHVLENAKTITANLDALQVCMIYEAISSLIAACPVPQQEQLIQRLMSDINSAMISNPSNLTLISHLIKINIYACRPIGPAFATQLQTILPLLAQYYPAASQDISMEKVNSNTQKRIRQLILELLDTFILSNYKLTLGPDFMPLLYVILADYEQEQYSKREAKVLSLLTSIFEKLPESVDHELLNRTIAIEFITTLPMIKENFIDYPDIRHEYYRLLRALCKKCFIDLFQLPELFPVVIDSILWGIKHTIRDISQLTLKTCLDLINDVVELEDEDISSEFFEKYYVRLLTDTIEVLVDPDCRNGFNYQSQVLARLLELVHTGDIYTRLFNPEHVSNPLMSNVEFLQGYVMDLLCHAFPLLQRDQLEVLVLGMFEYSGDLQKFQDDIRDFLTDIREVAEESIGYERKKEEQEAELELLRCI